MPDVVYKYYSFNEYSLDALLTNRVWLSKPSSFNDPFDCALTRDIIAHNKERDAYFEAMRSMPGKEKDMSAISRAPVPEWVLSVGISDLRNKLDSIGVCSFSEQNKSILMWSHYADRHRGFCIEYDCSYGSSLHSELQRVEYANRIPLITIKDYNRSDNEKKKAYVARLAILKSPEWSYEKEWRLVKEYNNAYYERMLKIKAVYFGARMPDDKRLEIMELIKDRAQKPEIGFFQIVRSADAFELSELFITST
ncbi:MAG: DUF2971 domain-containing protein [Candidatus Jettenia caeni]|nr:DUF2971 domain-containing protein [Candidatus Jettenia caeni]